MSGVVSRPVVDHRLQPLDCKAPSVPFADFAAGENRFQILQKSDPEAAAQLLVSAQEHLDLHWRTFEHMAKLSYSEGEAG